MGRDRTPPAAAAAAAAAAAVASLKAYSLLTGTDLLAPLFTYLKSEKKYVVRSACQNWGCLMAPCSQIVVYAPCERMDASLEDPSKIDG